MVKKTKKTKIVIVYGQDNVWVIQEEDGTPTRYKSTEEARKELMGHILIDSFGGWVFDVENGDVEEI